MSVIEREVPKGYQQTDVGVIPVEWESVNFGDLFQQSITRKQLKPNDCITFIGMQDVSESAQLTSPKNRIYEQVKTGFTYFEKNDVLVAKITPCFENGKGCYTHEINTEVGFGSTEFHVLRAKEKSDSKFIYFWTTRNSLRQDLEGEMVGSAGHRRVPLAALQNYRIPCPSNSEEQTAIANALSDVDALLTELENLIAKKQAIKTATMQQLLTGKTRLPQFATHTEGEKQDQPKGTKPSELGEIPEDWDVKAFGQVMCIRHGKDQKAVQVVDGLYPIFGTGGKMGTTNTPLYDKPSVLIGRKGTINKPRYADNPFWTVDTLFYSEIAPNAEPKFIFYKFCMIDWMQYNEASGVPSLNASTIESVTASFPSKEEQTAIATILSDMDNEIQTLEQRLKKTRQIKQGMMQELLTGRTRLPF
ncbi:restriction endonuclease subunit S [Alteromonas sp. M12]|uniref:restriction endonuclease subunit S n=1 Tax=Alteromonas sp. M12 TaxID=3135644 RepID=UPI00319E8A2D